MFLSDALRPQADYFANPSINTDAGDNAAGAGYVKRSITRCLCQPTKTNF